MSKLQKVLETLLKNEIEGLEEYFYNWKQAAQFSDRHANITWLLFFIKLDFDYTCAFTNWSGQVARHRALVNRET